MADAPIPAAAPSTPAPAAAPAATAAPSPRPGIPDADALLAMTVEGAPATAPTTTEATPAAADPAKDDADPAVTSRLAKIAGAEKRLKAERDAWKAEQKATLEAAANWTKVQEAKTKGEALTALRALYSEDEITTDLYQKLTDHIYAGANGATGLTKAEADKLVEDKLAAAKAAELAAAEKVKQETAAASEAKTAQVRDGYLAYVTAAYDPAKYPAIDAFPVTGPEILAMTEKHYAEHKAAPTAEEVLAHFEQDRRARAAKLNPAPAPRPVARGVTESWRSDAPPSNGASRRLSMAEIDDLVMKEAGLT